MKCCSQGKTVSESFYCRKDDIELSLITCYFLNSLKNQEYLQAKKKTSFCHTFCYYIVCRYFKQLEPKQMKYIIISFCYFIACRYLAAKCNWSESRWKHYLIVDTFEVLRVKSRWIYPSLRLLTVHVFPFHDFFCRLAVIENNDRKQTERYLN